MKIIIAGSRDIADIHLVERAMRESFAEHHVTAVISGCARGVDTLGEQWAVARNIAVMRFPADWNTHGKRAGFMRNVQMAEAADGLVAIWDGKSRGTKHMIDIATSRGLRVYVLHYPGDTQ